MKTVCVKPASRGKLEKQLRTGKLTKTFHEIGGYDERFVTAQDLDLFLKMSEAGKLENLSDILLHYRKHRCSINHTKSQTWSEMKQLAIGNAINRIGVKSYLSSHRDQKGNAGISKKI